ncbi:MAG: geranylgeranyl reductase family protein [Bacteroidetes bacterium]|nr:geranylgeranyl reductase family protein [Bacteroidota bacterium]
MLSFDIAIIGAGPAGCAAALTLAQSNCRVALFEKETFPRPKICGDGVCDRSVNTLRAISQEYYDEFMQFAEKQTMSSTTFVYKNNRSVLNLKNFGYVCKREFFDNFLFSLVQRNSQNVEVFQQTPVQYFDKLSNQEKTEQGFILHDAQGNTYKTYLLIVANGAKSNIAQQLTGEKYSEKENGVAIRAYYEGVSGCDAQSIELHYKKEYFPGYLWIFPMANGICNVGFGGAIEKLKTQPENIQAIMQQWISGDEELKKRFANARIISPIQGGLVPYNNNVFNCSGEGFMICGDAASLIDPISGGGIGNAMLSGRLAALQAVDCVQTQDFSAQKTKLYEEALKKRIQREIKNRLRIQRAIIRFPFLLNVLSFVSKNQKIFNRIARWYN